jgi:hypothetical protein
MNPRGPRFLSDFCLLGKARAFGLFSVFFIVPHLSPQNVLNSITLLSQYALPKVFPFSQIRQGPKGGGIPSSNKSFNVGEGSFKVFVFFWVLRWVDTMVHCKNKEFWKCKVKKPETRGG